jgi:hypothetical protein
MPINDMFARLQQQANQAQQQAQAQAQQQTQQAQQQAQAQVSTPGQFQGAGAGGGQAGVGQGQPLVTQENANNARVFSGGNEMQEVRDAVDQFEAFAADPETGREFVQQLLDLSALKGAIAGVGINIVEPEPAVNTPAGVSLLEYDGLPYEAHKRSVSIKKPEILGRFAFKPVFQTAGNNGVSLTPEGAFLDVQINARKIRIDDIQSLFDEMSADPESPTGKLAANLIEELESNLTQARASFETLSDITNRINQFISALKVRSTQQSTGERMSAFRGSRLDDQDFLPDSLEKNLDFRKLMTNNHFFTEEQVNTFSSTKLMYYLGYDIKSALQGPAFTTKGKQTLRAARNRVPQGLDDFSAVTDVGDDEVILFGSPEINTLKPFNIGICTTEKDKTHVAPRSLRSTSVSRNSPTVTTLFVNEEDTAEACSLLISTISRTFAQSSAIGDDEFMSQFKNEFGTLKSSVADALFSLLPRPGLVPNETSVKNDKSFTKTLLYNQAPEGFTEILRPFDPDLPALLSGISDDNDGPSNVSNTVFNKFIKPVLDSTAAGSPDAAALDRYTREVPGKLRKVASSIEYILALKNDAFDPLNILNKALLNFKNRLDDLNIQESNDGFISRYWVDFCLLSEAYHDANGGGRISTNRFPTGQETPRSITVGYYPFNTLLTTYLICLGKDRDVDDNFFDLVIDANSDPLSPAENNRLARLLGKHARFGLTNACTNFRTPVAEGDFTGESPPGTVGGANVAHISDVLNSSYGTASEIQGSRNFPGIAEPGYEGEIFAERSLNNQRYTDFRHLHEKLDYLARNKTNSPTDWQVTADRDGYGFPFGTKIRRRDGSGYGTAFGTMRSSNMGIPGMGQKLFRREDSQLVENRLVEIAQTQLDNSIFGDMIAHIDELHAAARARGSIVDPTTKRMISSAVDPSVMVSFLVSLYSHISNNLLQVYFCPVRLFRSGNNEFSKLSNFRQWTANSILPIQMQTDFKDQTFKFKRQLDQYIDNDGNINGMGPLKDFISDFKDEYRGDQAVLLDFIDTMRAIADEIESVSQSLKSSFVDSQGNLVDDPAFKRVASFVDDAVEPSQIILAKNKLISIEEKSGKRKFFDDFMVDRAQENFFYTMLRDQRSPNADNMDILPIGIPFGFTRGVLGNNPVLDPDGFNNRLVDIIVYKKDLILGRRIQISQKKFTFDLGMFIGNITDPVASSPETRTSSIINPQTNDIILSRGVTERNYPDNLQAVLENNVEFRKILYGEADPILVPFSNAGTIGTSPSGLVFKNHVLDHVAKTYIKVATGIDIDEQNIFIDPAFERRNSNDSDLVNFQALVNARLAQILGREVNFVDYLSGNRGTREIVKRLTDSKKTNPVIAEIRTFLDGNSENQDTITSEDLVAFSRMLSPNNSLITPGLTRDKIVAPKLFERVFCIFVDPDDFDVIPGMSESDLINSPPGNIYLQGNPGSLRHKQIPKSAGLPQATTYNVAIKASTEES